MEPIVYFPQQSWQTEFTAAEQAQGIQDLEEGKVLFFNKLGFELSSHEKLLISPQFASPKAKNISFDARSGELKGTLCEGENFQQVRALMARYGEQCQTLVQNLFPHYHSQLIVGRTSLRTIEVQGRSNSAKKDDTRLHIDAFPATPTGAQRILRVFCNINQNGKERVWHLGEPFAEVAKKFFPQATPPIPGIRSLMKLCKLTKSFRTTYDHYMLQIHDRMKLDRNYQTSVAKTRFAFPPGSTWMVFTDQVSHAALAGQHLLEQTFYLPYHAMYDQNLAPQQVLCELAGKRLLPD